jgi:predicted NBD/HSP70 family sugar kinase
MRLWQEVHLKAISPAAFLSYTHADDQHNSGYISEFRKRLAAEVALQRGQDIDIFQDRTDIEWGQRWQERIDNAIDGATILIPILTPYYFRSSACRDELARFLQREAELGRSDLILPVYYVTASVLEKSGERDADELAKEIRRRQFADWRPLRFVSFDSTTGRKEIAKLAGQMCTAFSTMSSSITFAASSGTSGDDSVQPETSVPLGVDALLLAARDDSTVADLLLENLKGQGYRTLRAVSAGSAGLEARLPPDLPQARFILPILTRASSMNAELQAYNADSSSEGLRSRGAVVLPLLYEDCPIPQVFQSMGYIDFRFSIADGMAHLGEVLELPETMQTLPRLGAQRDRLRAALTSSTRLCLAMDVGGTKAYVSLMNSDAVRLFDKKFGTRSHDNQVGLSEFLVACIQETLDSIKQVSEMSADFISGRISAIGIAFAGPTDYEKGVILDAPNFNVKNLHLKDEIEAATNFPTFVDNDVNLGVVGEMWKGVGRGYKNVVGVIIGTGIGGGMVLDGRLHRGAGNTAGEIGHLVLDRDSSRKCGCGQFGCAEALASRRAIARDLSEVKRNRGIQGIHWTIANLGSNEIAYHFKSGDSDTIEVVTNAARTCGKLVFSLLNLLNPDLVFFGGGFVRQIGDTFLESVRTEASKCMNSIYETPNGPVPITIGKLDNPMLVGACMMAMQRNSSSVDWGDIARRHMGRLDELQEQILEALYDRPLPISKDPGSDFYEETLRPLRNLGLIATNTGKSFRRSNLVELTEFGRAIVEERRGLSIDPGRSGSET